MEAVTPLNDKKMYSGQPAQPDRKGNQMKDNKKVTAAIAAVTHYLRMEKEAILMQQAALAGMPQVPSIPVPEKTVSPWCMNGRQTQMQMRNLMQLRTFR